MRSYRHKVCIDVVGVWIGVVNREPDPTVIIYNQMWKNRQKFEMLLRILVILCIIRGIALTR